MTKRGHVAIQNTETGRREVPGRRFSTYIGQTQHWFTIHKPRGCDHVVSDERTGMCFGFVTATEVCAALGDEILAARGMIARKVEQHGAARMRSILASPPDLPPYRAKADTP